MIMGVKIQLSAKNIKGKQKMYDINNISENRSVTKRAI